MDKPCQLCTCTHSWVSLLTPTNAASRRHRPWTRTGTDISGRVGAALTGFASRRQMALHNYLPCMLGEAGAAPTGVASCWKSAPAMSGVLVQHLLSMHPVDNRPWLPRLPSRILGRACTPPTNQYCLLSTTGPGHVPARITGRAGAAFTGVDSHRQADLDVYLHTCKGELALPSVDNRP